MRSRGSVTYYPWFGDTVIGSAPSVVYYFGAAPSEVYLPGVPASGNITGSFAGNVLTPVTTPLYQQALTGGAGDPLGAGFDNGTTDSFDAASSSVHDTAGAIACLTTARVTAGAGNGTLVGKFSSSPVRGWMHYRSGGAANWFVAGVPNYAYVAILAQPTGSVIYIFGWWSVVSGQIGIMGSWGTPAVLPYTYGSTSNAATFALGSVNTYAAPAAVDGPTIIWTGAAAETVIAARATKIPAWATATGAF